MLPQVSIIIVNWNSADYVRKCIRSLIEHSAHIHCEVIVVDGGSFDGCKQMLDAEFPNTKFIQLTENRGFGAANNVGVQAATAEILWLLNPDTEVTQGALDALLSQVQSCSDVGVVGAYLLNSDGSLQTSCVRAFPTPVNRALDSEWLRKLLPRSKLWGTFKAFNSSLPVEVEAVSGACMLIRAETFRYVGGFSPEFFMYGEDMDLCFKVQKAGFRNVFVPTARIVHHGGGSSRSRESEFSTLMMRIAGEKYMRRNLGICAVIQFRFLQLLSAMLRLGIAAAGYMIFGKSRRGAFAHTLRRWWCVLRWACGIRVQKT